MINLNKFIFYILFAILTCCYPLSAVAANILAKDYVVPILWSEFSKIDKILSESEYFGLTAKILANSVRYNLQWMPLAIEDIEKKNGDAHDVIRPACSAVKAVAIAIKTDLFDHFELAVSEERAIKNTIQLIEAVIDTHAGTSWWGKLSQRQGAWWASQVGQAGWLLWEYLNEDQRASLADVIQYEANRLISLDVPYWNGRGGDTKAEENAWNATIFFTAVAMMPAHPNVNLWKSKCSELMVSSYSKESDLKNENIVDGKRTKDWLNGFNAFENGSVSNHNHAGHPSYTARIQVILESFCVQPLAGQLVPEAADFNLNSTYDWLVKNIYIKGSHQIVDYEWDWTSKFYYLYYCLDIQTHLLKFNTSVEIKDWIILRGAKILEMQGRHPDGHAFEQNETKWPQGFEQDLAVTVSNAYLHLWLDSQGKVRQGNWLAGDV